MNNNNELFREQVLNNERDSMWGSAIIQTPVSFAIFTTIAVIICGTTLIFLFSNEYSKKQVVRGYITPNLGAVKIYPSLTGYFSDIYVNESQEVKRGDILATITKQQKNKKSGNIYDAKVHENKIRMNTTINQLKSIEDITKLENIKLKQNIFQTKKEINLLKEQKKILKKRLSISEKKHQRALSLINTHFISQQDFEKILDTHLQQKDRMHQFEIELLHKQKQLLNFKSVLSQLSSRTENKRLKIANELSIIRTSLLQLNNDHSTDVTAPIAGTITGIQMKTGKTAKNNRSLLTIIPVGQQFLAYLYVPTRAIGNLSVNQRVRFKFDAFPYQKYGIYYGKIDEITQTIFRTDELDIPIKIDQSSYRITVSLNKQFVEAYGKQFNLQAGMTLSAEIVYDNRTLLNWLLEPLSSLQG